VINQSSFAADDTGDLHCIWQVDGDQEYNYRQSRVADSGLVAIRTLSGSGALDTDSRGLRIVNAGTLMITEQRRLRYYGTYDRSWRFFWFEFSRGCGEGLPWDEIIDVAPTVWEEPVLQHVFAQLSVPDACAQESAMAMFRALLCHWTVAYSVTGRRSNSAGDLVRRAVEQFNMADPSTVSLETVAAEVGVSSRRLRQAFVKELGRSPKRYFNSMRMRQAAQALKMGRGNVTQISEQLGYASPFHFSSAFKAEFGCCPSRYVETLSR
jgi:AraC-like DNA-binding protein